MKKMIPKTLVLFSLIALIANAVPPVFAAGTVIYEGNAQKFIFEPGSGYSPTDLFDSFKGVMPGDRLTQRITVRNDSYYGVKVNIYMRSLGAHKNSVKFLSQLHMTVTKSEDNQMAYMFDAAADRTDGLTDWVLLGTLYSGGEVQLDINLDVPIELGNEYQDAIGYIDWQFKIEEFPIDPDDPIAPPTGETPMYPYVIIASLSGMALVLLLMRKTRRQQRREC